MVSAVRNSVNSVMINSGVMLVQNMDVSGDLIDIHLNNFNLQQQKNIQSLKIHLAFKKNNVGN